jgi:hypothetical protein
MTYAEAVKRVLDLLDRSVDLVEGCDWEDPEDPDGEEEDDEEQEGADEPDYIPNLPGKIVALGRAS